MVESYTTCIILIDLIDDIVMLVTPRVFELKKFLFIWYHTIYLSINKTKHI